MMRWSLCLVFGLAPLAVVAAQGDFALQLETSGDRFIATGVLFPQSGSHVDAARRARPDISTLVLQYVPGSDDENDYMDAALKLRQAGFTTIVPADGLVASGGTDFFFAGIHRVIEPGACIGVHSWADDGPPAYQASDLPRDHQDHEDFLRYFAAIGAPAEFYWFTITAAPADGMHWMSPEEINRFGMSTRPVPASNESAAARAERCDARASGADG